MRPRLGPSSRFPLRPRTLRARLTAGLGVLLAAVCLTVGLATTAALETFLMGRLDEQLITVGTRFPATLDPARGDPADTRGQASGTFGGCVMGDVVRSAAVVRDQSERSLTLTEADERSLRSVPSDGEPRTIPLSQVGDYRVVGVPGPAGDVLITGLPTQPVEDTLQRLRMVGAVVIGVAVLLTGVVGALWAGLALRPLRRVAAIASQVESVPLADGEVTGLRRVPDTDRRTEVGRVGHAFNRMLRHIEQALAQRQASEQRLRQFATDASHELRTPIATIRGHAELAQRHGRPVPAEVLHALDRIQHESVRMGELVDDLLLLARLDAGRQLARHPVDLTRLVLDTVGDARAAGREHRWELHLPEEPVTLVGDERGLQQVLANLLANARIHTPPGTTVRAGLRERSREVEIFVEDDGPGVPVEIRAKVFDRFVHSGEGRSRGAGGAGLGLSITQAVACAHDGRVTLDSRPGRTTFRVRLPRCP